jgi:hypothetical protein
VTTRREGQCPLCGAKLTPTQVLDACEEIADAALGALTCRCPYCQGHFDVRPGEGRVDIGYVQYDRFDCVLSLPCTGLAVLRDTTTGALRVHSAECEWAFNE